MRKKFTFVIWIGLLLILTQATTTYAQELSVGDTSVAHPSAIASFNSTTQGILPPRVALTATNSGGPITLPETGLWVYNTATAGSAPNNVMPGYYYNAGTSGSPNWVRVTPNGWQLNGNTGTVAPTSAIGSAINNNFIGTTDPIHFAFATSGFERMRITSSGNVGIGTIAPTSTALLTINPTTNTMRNGIDMNLSGASSNALGINIAMNDQNIRGIMVDNSSTGASNPYWSVGGTLSGNTGSVLNKSVSGYLAYRTGSGNSYGLWSSSGTSAWAGFFQGKVAITNSSENPPTSAVDFEVRNTTTGSGNPATISLRQSIQQTTNGVLGNINFSDSYSADGTTPHAQIKVLRDAASGTNDYPTAIVLLTTNDGAATPTEKFRITNTGANAYGGATNTGTAGQVPTSIGPSGPPVWTTPTSKMHVPLSNVNLPAGSTRYHYYNDLYVGYVINPGTTGLAQEDAAMLSNYVATTAGEKITQITGWANNQTSTTTTTLNLYLYKYSPTSGSFYSNALAGTLVGSVAVVLISGNPYSFVLTPINSTVATLAAGDILIMYMQTIATTNTYSYSATLELTIPN